MRVFMVVFVIAGLVGFGSTALGAMAGPGVTGQGMGNPTSSYQVSFTIHPGDPTIEDFHLWWEPPTNPAPSQAKWSTNIPPGWVCNTGYATHPDQDRTSNVNHVSFTNPNGVTAPPTGPITLTFTYAPYGSGYTPVTPQYMITNDGNSNLPADYGQPSIEHMGPVAQSPPAGFPTR